MKKLRDMVPLDGTSETITVMDLRKSPGEVLEQAAMGKTYTVTKNGKPIVTIKRIPPPPVILGAEVRRLGLAGD